MDLPPHDLEDTLVCVLEKLSPSFMLQSEVSFSCVGVYQV